MFKSCGTEVRLAFVQSVLMECRSVNLQTHTLGQESIMTLLLFLMPFFSESAINGVVVIELTINMCDANKTNANNFPQMPNVIDEEVFLRLPTFLFIPFGITIDCVEYSVEEICCRRLPFIIIHLNIHF